MKSAPPKIRVDGSRRTELDAAEALEQIPGVLAAAVWLGEASSIREVYIAVAPQASVAAIQQAAAEILRRAGLPFAANAIQIGQIDEVATTASQPAAPGGEQPAPGNNPPWQGRFLILAGLDILRSGAHVTAKVKLVRLGESFESECQELDTETGRARAAARATLAAAEKASTTARLGLEGVQITELFGRRFVVVSVEAATARRFMTLSGILETDATRSVEESSCLATLRAVERWVAW